MKVIVSFLIAVLCTTALFSQKIDSLQSSLLWEIKGKKVESPSYIMGTMHMIPKAKFLFPEHVKTKLQNSELLVMEIGGISEGANMVQFMMLDTGNVFNYFNASQLDSLFTYTDEELGYDEDQMRMMFSKMKPLVIMQLLSKNTFGDDPESYELTLEEIAKNDTIEIEGLETIEEQVAIFDKIPLDDQVEMLMLSLKEQYNNEDNTTEELIEVFLAQDIDSIYRYTTASSSDMESMETDFLINRNKNWIPQIRKLIKKNKCFIAVGAAHLGGPNGVIQLLREEGYELIPVKL
jgi:uncharacterized protein YbaP (TraB family)